MPARKPATAPVTGVDEELGNELADRKDALLDTLQDVRQRRTLRDARYERDRKRLDAAYAADCKAMDDQVVRAERALAGVNAANEAMKDAAEKVVHLKVAAQ